MPNYLKLKAESPTFSWLAPVEYFSLLVILVALIPTNCESLAWGQEDASAALWQYYPPLNTAAAGNSPAISSYQPVPMQNSPRETVDEMPDEQPREYSVSGSSHDPQFDSETRPSWRPQTFVKPLFTRPTYDYPNYDAPMYRLEPVRKAVIDRPTYVAPEVNRPNYTREFTEGPAEIAPTLAAPDYKRPDYVVHPYEPPAINAPTVDRSETNYHPEAYKGPVYKPDEYRAPHQLPPEYMPPPME
jgi:hypothetical protein